MYETGMKGPNLAAKPLHSEIVVVRTRILVKKLTRFVFLMATI
jgi:hypothetical protein